MEIKKKPDVKIIDDFCTACNKVTKHTSYMGVHPGDQGFNKWCCKCSLWTNIDPNGKTHVFINERCR